MRLNIRSKLIAISTLLVAFVVVVFAAVTQQMVKGDLENEQRRVSARRLQAMETSGLLLTQTVAQGSLPLLANTQIPDMETLVEQLVTRSQSEESGVEVVRAGILDAAGRTMASAPADQELAIEMEHLGLGALDELQHAAVFTLGDDNGNELSNFIAIAPIHAGDLRLGYAILEIGIGPLVSELDEIAVFTATRIDDIERNTTILGGLAILLGILIAVVQSLRLTSPILRLAASAEKIAAGDLETRTDVKSRDEIGKLSQSFNHMAERIQELLRETQEKVALQKELEVARVIQETLLPPSGVIDRDPLRIYGYFRAASVCGGDFWSVGDLQDGRTLVVIGDVTGHGVPSAMITASAKSSMETVLNIQGNDLSLTFLLEEMNRTIFASAKRKFVMTFFAMAFDTARGELHYSNAGHHFPFLVRKEDGQIEVSSLVARGNRLGDVEDSRYMEQRIEVRSGDLIAMYTDGLTEYRNSNGDEYSERRFRRLLEQCYTLDAEEVGQTILRDLSQFATHSPQEDDVTLVIIKIGTLHTASGSSRRNTPAVPRVT